MVFKYTIKKNLPPLSWIAIVSENCDTIEVIAGRTVETFDSFFVSGVWDGDFIKGDFDHCNFSCCTGAIIRDDKVLFVTPHHLNSCIFSIRQKNNLYLSNSASFLLAYTDNEFNPNYYQYDNDFCCETLGKRNLIPPFHSFAPLLNKSHINIYSYCKIEIQNNLVVSINRHSSNFQFHDFDNYRIALSSTLQLIRRNVNSEYRKCHYGMIATISRGYDAPTCAVLAKEIGCDEIFTFNRPNHYKNDCGTEIAKVLGYDTIHECDGDLVKTNTEYIEAADFASGDTGSMITFEGQKNLFKNKLLFCGFRGDDYWSIANSPNNNLISITETSSENSYEVFLESNTIMIMIPYIGADHASDIYNISLSEEMKPWRLGVRYDRPICRRIVEEAGVERNSFGKKKVGSGYCFHYDTLHSIGNKLSPQSYKSLMAFSKELRQNPFMKFKAYCIFLYYNIPIYLPYFFNKLNIKITMKPWTKKHLSNPVSTTYILWGVDHMMKKYKKAIEQS